MSTSLPSRKNLGRIPHLPLAPSGGDPLKGILKKQPESQPLPQQKSTASSLRQVISVPSFAFLSSRFKTTSAEVTPAEVQVPVEIDGEGGVIKPSVGFSNRDAVAIIGDTSDDLTTEAENSEKLARRPFLTTPRRAPAAIVSPIRKVSLTETTVFTPTGNGVNANDSNGVANGEESTTEDDTISVQSSSSAAPSDGVSASHLERWWTGKSTKFVLHCDRRGCNHRHSPAKNGAGDEQQLNASSERYETPTQRKNKEVTKLTKELRRCHHELREKERHLSELRSRLGEIESLIDEGRLLDENSRLMQRLREREGEFREERQIVAERHEIRQRQLIQETVDARAEATRKTMQLERLCAQLEVAKLDASTMTTPDSDGEGGGGESDASLAGPSQARSSSTARAHLGVSASAPTSPSTADKQRLHQHQVATLTQETMTQLEAYRNEALIWRTKSAQLEIVVKELLLTSEKETQRYTADLSARSDEVNELKETVRRLSILPPAVDGSHQQELDDASALKSEAPTECQLGSCSERKRMLIDENQKLLEQISEKSDGIERLQRELDDLGGEYAKSKSELDDLRSIHAELGKLAEERKVECMAAQMTLDRLQIEKDTLKKAISYLESRHQVYQNVILDNNLHVHDESTEEWRHGFADPQFSLYLTKEVQTALTLNELNINEKELAVLQIKLREVEMEFSRDSAALHDKFSEIERNLVSKTRLVEKLSGQLEQSARRAQLSDEQKQRERETYQARIDDLAAIAERVPILENEIERAREARSQLEISFRKTTEAFDDHLGDSFKQSLKKQQDLEDYWRQRVQNVDEARMKAVAYGEVLEKNVAELKLRHGVERTELERRLASAIAHVELLNARINFPRKDAQCEARPKTANKYVGCKPNQRHKSTAILRGEIPDLELNQYKVDLLLAKRRIEELEAKLRRHAPQTLLQTETTRAGSVEHTFGRAYYFKNRDSGTVQLTIGTNAPMREEADEISISSSPGANIDGAAHHRRQTSVCASPPSTEREDYKRLHLEVVVKKLKEANKRHIYEKFVLGEKVHQLESELSEVRREELLAKLHGGKVGVSGTGAARARRRANSLFVSSRGLQDTTALVGRVAPVKRLQIARYKLDELRWRGEEAKTACAPDELHAICAELEDILSHEERRVAAGVPVERFMELKGENDLLLDQLARVKETLGRAELELGIYRREPREEAKARQGDARLQRSGSLVQLDTSSATPQELRMWKEKAGALFREVNSLRMTLDGCRNQRDEYKRELLMLRGELVLAKCQAILEEERAIRASRWRCRRRSQPGVQWLDELESVIPTSARRVSLSPRRSPLISTSRVDRYSPRASRDTVPTSDDPHGSVLRRRSQGGFQSPMEKELRIVQEALHRQTTALRDKNRELETRVELLELRNLGAMASEGEEPKKSESVEELENHVIRLESENAMLRTTNDLYEKKVREIEEDQAKMYLIMFRKGQQAANADIKEDMDAMTEQRVMLRFLHDAFYYYLLNRGSSREHLQAIMTMLDFTNEQKEEVYRRRGASH